MRTLTLVLALTLAAPAFAQAPPGPPVRGPRPEAPPRVEYQIKPAKPFVYDAERPELLYRDRSWTHIGNDNFAKTSDGADDLTRKAKGTTLKLVIALGEAQLKAIADPRWKRVTLRGSVIGNDTGRVGCSATTVTMGGKPIGKIVKSGSIKLAVSKQALLDARDPKTGAVTFVIDSGRTPTDVDDQELGKFKLVLGEEALPKPAAQPEVKPQPGAKRPGEAPAGEQPE